MIIGEFKIGDGWREYQQVQGAVGSVSNLHELHWHPTIFNVPLYDKVLFIHTEVQHSFAENIITFNDKYPHNEFAFYLIFIRC